MNLTLRREDFREDGIFGELIGGGKVIAATLEHAYDSGNGDGTFVPKLQPGNYKCVRGQHQLHGNLPFITFEVTGVTGHKGILFHVGNFNKDSEGCILLGERRVAMADHDMVSNSRNTFAAFMGLMSGVNEFELTVI